MSEQTDDYKLVYVPGSVELDWPTHAEEPEPIDYGHLITCFAATSVAIIAVALAAYGVWIITL